MLFFYIQFFIQVVSESLPVSSSGHLKLFSCLFRQAPIVGPELLEWMHIPTLMVLTLYFSPVLYKLVVCLPKIWRRLLYLGLVVFMADCITALGYFLFKIQHYDVPLYISFLVTAALLISTKLCAPGTKKTLTLVDGVCLGVVQALSLLPGISRFGSVYAVCRWLGCTARESFYISWLIVWPLLCATSIKLFFKSHSVLMFSVTDLLVVSCAGFVALGVLHGVYLVAQNNRMWWIGIYMIIPACVAFISRC